MAADSNQESSLSACTGALPQFKPNDRMEYLKNRDAWINLLFKDIVFIHDDPQHEDLGETVFVRQNIPNPFSSSTEIPIKISEACVVNISVTNMMGQRVNTIVTSFPEEGEYTITIDLSENSDGIYFITIYENQKEIGKIKALKSN